MGTKFTVVVEIEFDRELPGTQANYERLAQNIVASLSDHSDFCNYPIHLAGAEAVVATALDSTGRVYYSTSIKGTR